MDLNLSVVAIAIILAVLLIYFIIRRNFRDQKDMEETIKKSELGLDRHKEDRI